MTMHHPAMEAGRQRRYVPNLWDAFAFGLLFGGLVLIVHGGHDALAPLATLEASPLSLDPALLPEYALRTTMRMLAAIVASLVFTFVYGALAAKCRRAEMVLIPLLDILQSVPVLGFLSFTVVGFMALFPGQVFGVELQLHGGVEAIGREPFRLHGGGLAHQGLREGAGTAGVEVRAEKQLGL